MAKAEEEGKEEEEDAIEARQKMESGGIAEMGEMLLVVQCPGCKITLPPFSQLPQRERRLPSFFTVRAI